MILLNLSYLERINLSCGFKYKGICVETICDAMFNEVQ